MLLKACYHLISSRRSITTYATWYMHDRRHAVSHLSPSPSSWARCCRGSDAIDASLVSITWLSELAESTSWSWKRLNCTDHTLRDGANGQQAVRNTTAPLPVGVVMTSHKWEFELASIPELHSAVISTRRKVVRLIRVIVQPPHTGTMQLLHREREPVEVQV